MGTFTVDNLVKLICNQYEIDETTARKDAIALAAQWGTAGIIEGDDIPEDQSTNEKELPAETKDAIKEDVLKQEDKPKKKGFFKRLLDKKIEKYRIKNVIRTVRFQIEHKKEGVTTLFFILCLKLTLHHTAHSRSCWHCWSVLNLVYNKTFSCQEHTCD